MVAGMDTLKHGGIDGAERTTIHSSTRRLLNPSIRRTSVVGQSVLKRTKSDEKRSSPSPVDEGEPEPVPIASA